MAEDKKKKNGRKLVFSRCGPKNCDLIIEWDGVSPTLLIREKGCSAYEIGAGAIYSIAVKHGTRKKKQRVVRGLLSLEKQTAEDGWDID